MGIKASCGLIQKQDLRLNNQLHTNVSPPPFPSRHTTEELCSNLSIEMVLTL